jgi:hypothetical protein
MSTPMPTRMAGLVSHPRPSRSGSLYRTTVARADLLPADRSGCLQTRTTSMGPSDAQAPAHEHPHGDVLGPRDRDTGQPFTVALGGEHDAPRQPSRWLAAEGATTATGASALQTARQFTLSTRSSGASVAMLHQLKRQRSMVSSSHRRAQGQPPYLRIRCHAANLPTG